MDGPTDGPTDAPTGSRTGARLCEPGLQLPEPRGPAGTYAATCLAGDVLYLSGTGR
jgi:hypothetical protein